MPFNSATILEAHFGVPAGGGILVAINHRLASPEVRYILGHSGARFLLLDSELEPLVAPLELPGVTVIPCASSGAPEDEYERFLRAASSAAPESWLEDEEETISINYTSGTTGQPKGVQYTYRGAYLNALSEVTRSATRALQMPRRDRLRAAPWAKVSCVASVRQFLCHGKGCSEAPI